MFLISSKYNYNVEKSNTATSLHTFFQTKDEQKVEHKTIFKTQEITCTCESSYGRGNRTLKHKRLVVLHLPI